MANAINAPLMASSAFVPVSGGYSPRETPAAEASEQETAAYLFDLLIGARRLAVARRHRFLAYLLGMAVEEARLLTMGRSAAGGNRNAANGE